MKLQTMAGLTKQEEVQVSSGQPAVDFSQFIGARILLAEDSTANQLLVTTILQHVGFNVDVANNGQEAVSAAAGKRYDLILMDMCMPEMDGLEATRIIRSDPETAHLPIIALTANALQEDVDNCLEAGMNGYLCKPINKDSFLEVVCFWLAKTAC